MALIRVSCVSNGAFQVALGASDQFSPGRLDIRSPMENRESSIYVCLSSYCYDFYQKKKNILNWLCTLHNSTHDFTLGPQTSRRWTCLWVKETPTSRKMTTRRRGAPGGSPNSSTNSTRNDPYSKAAVRPEKDPLKVSRWWKYVMTWNWSECAHLSSVVIACVCITFLTRPIR